MMHHVAESHDCTYSLTDELVVFESESTAESEVCCLFEIPPSFVGLRGIFN